MKKEYRVETFPAACPENIVQGNNYRITVLTERLLRLEYSPDGIFENRATQTVFYRDFPQCSFEVDKTADGIELRTRFLRLSYNEKEFSANGLCIRVGGNLTDYQSVWRYGQAASNLGGTARTLDEANGAIKLGSGVLSRNGYAVLDDSTSHILLADGWLEPRKKGIQDLYFFGYGQDYPQAIADFYRLCGKTPMLPRFALGNWWSRYYKYTEQSYLELMQRFKRENLPFTVAVIDMDWHLVDIDPKYGSGWTGYTWNRAFFPDPKRFLEQLHQMGMRTTLNVHPADGVRAHEEAYPQMAQAMGIDPKTEQPVACDPADPAYLEAYFSYLHHPREEEGVDFWWIDWQQGTSTKIEGLDPLWIFNHYHFLDSARNGKRPLTFSRYAGPGSHRYPVGFSGDTITTWESLDFQPYFTATASNIGYGWWSHDIGGHMQGYKDDELTARWVQYGVYSPIMRLHSTCSEFNGKEPWRYKKETELVMGEMLRERHRMIPYLYTMSHRNFCENVPLVTPMYYQHPNRHEAYDFKNQYYFGTLLVAPITSPRIKGINHAKVTAWLPEGLWYDLYTGMTYDGDRTIELYRSLESIPVLAPAGTILPCTNEISPQQASTNPASLWIRVFGGKNGSFELYEDDNETCDYQRGICCTTKMEYCEAEQAVFTIHPAQGEASLIPSQRSYTIELTGFEDMSNQISVTVDGKAVPFQAEYRAQKKAVCIELQAVATSATLCISLPAALKKQNDEHARCFALLNQAEVDFSVKDAVYSLIEQEKRLPVLLAQLATMQLPQGMYGALAEILTASAE